MKVINFYEKDMSLSNGYEYSINALGGEINIPFWINFDYVLKVDSSSSSWLSVVEADTKAESRKETVTLSVEKNNETSARIGYVNVCAANNPSKVPKHTSSLKECAGGADRRQGHLRVTHLWETGRRATEETRKLQRSRSNQDGQ